MTLSKKIKFLIALFFCMDMCIVRATPEDDVLGVIFCIGAAATGVYGVYYRVFLRQANRQILKKGKELLASTKNLNFEFREYARSHQNSKRVLSLDTEYKEKIESAMSKLTDVKILMNSRNDFFWNCLYKERFEEHCKDSNLLSKHLKVDLEILEARAKLDRLNKVFRKHSQESNMNNVASLIVFDHTELFPLIEADKILVRTLLLLDHYAPDIECSADFRAWIEKISEDIAQSNELTQQVKNSEIYKQKQARIQRAIELEEAKIAEAEGNAELAHAQANRQNAEAFKNRLDSARNAAIAYQGLRNDGKVAKELIGAAFPKK